MRSAFRACAKFTHAFWQAPGLLRKHWTLLTFVFEFLNWLFQLRIPSNVKYDRGFVFLTLKTWKRLKFIARLVKCTKKHYGRWNDSELLKIDAWMFMLRNEVGGQVICHYWWFGASFGWELLDHAPYNPDLSPSIYHMFLYSKKHLGGLHQKDNDKV